VLNLVTKEFLFLVLNRVAFVLAGITLLVGLSEGDVCLTIVGATCYLAHFYKMVAHEG
jgi:hypothetical protein